MTYPIEVTAAIPHQICAMAELASDRLISQRGTITMIHHRPRSFEVNTITLQQYNVVAINKLHVHDDVIMLVSH